MQVNISDQGSSQSPSYKSARTSARYWPETALWEAHVMCTELVVANPEVVQSRMVKNLASSGKSVGNWRAQRYGSLRNRWSLRHVASRECCSSSEPLWISGPPSA